MAGRKRAFDREIALDKAMRVFWNNGFAGTSVSNLTSELGINTPSLYAAFGNKEQLFKEVMSHYSTHYVSRHYKNLIGESELSFKERLEVCFSGLIALFTDGETPLGCLLVKSVNESESVAFPEEVRQRQYNTANLAKRRKVDGEVEGIGEESQETQKANQWFEEAEEAEQALSSQPDAEMVKAMAAHLVPRSQG